MIKSLIFCSIIACDLAAAHPQNLRPLIVGGAAAEISNFPWQISLQRGGNHFCGGSIYSEKIIVTAAHCLQSAFVCSGFPLLGIICHFVQGGALTVRAGSSQVNSGGVVIPVAAFKTHEDFDIKTMVNDIAVIRLQSPLTYGPGIKNIPLTFVAPSNDAAASVSGWGTTFYGANTIPSTLQSVDVTIIGLTECSSSAYGYGNTVKPTMICAADAGKDACQGDSGGPLVSGGVLVGIVSWGVGCANASYPGVYADVAELYTWADNAAIIV